MANTIEYRGQTVQALISSDEDIIVIDNFCEKCAEKKLRVKVYHVWKIGNKELKELKNLGVRGVRIRCEC